MRTMGSGTFTTESECVDDARIQTAAYGREDPSLSLMFVVPSQAGMELRRPTESRLQTRQRADRVSLESLETAPTTFEPLHHEL